MNKNRFSINGQFSLVNGTIGDHTTIWNFVNIMAGATIGACCTICDYVFIESGVTIGNDVIIKNGVQLWKGITIEDAVFIGPGVVFTNDRYPRSKYIKQVEAGYSPDAPYAIQEDEWLEKTLVKKGSTIGANATILCGVTIGEMATIGAGSVVVKDVPPFCTAVGNPARIIKDTNDR